jgi:tape measure domain-containing protein
VAINVLELMGRVSLDVSGFEAGVRRVESRKKALVDAFNNIGKMMSIGVTTPLVALGVASVRAASRMDGLMRGLTAVAGSAKEAEAQFARLKEIAKLPGLGREEAVAASVSLQAAGLSAQTAERSLLAFGNALATVGKGKAELDGVTLALTQIASKGKVTAEEINQIAERVPQIRTAMKAAFGTASTEELQKAGLTAQKFIDGITTELLKLPKVTGGVQNAFENLQDTINEALANIGQNILPTLLPAIEKISTVVTNLTQKFAELSPETRRTILIVAALAAATGPLIVGFGMVAGAISNVIALFTAMSGIVGAIAGTISLPLIAGIAAVVAALGLMVLAWRGNWGNIQGITVAAARSIPRIVDAGMKIVNKVWVDWIRPMVTVITDAWNAIVKVFQRGVDIIGGVLGRLSGTFKKTIADAAIQAINPALGALNNMTGATKIFGEELAKVKQEQEAGTFVDPIQAGLNKLKTTFENMKKQLSTPIKTSKISIPGVSGPKFDLKGALAAADAQKKGAAAAKRMQGITDQLRDSLNRARQEYQLLKAGADATTIAVLTGNQVFNKEQQTLRAGLLSFTRKNEAMRQARENTNRLREQVSRLELEQAKGAATTTEAKVKLELFGRTTRALTADEEELVRRAVNATNAIKNQQAADEAATTAKRAAEEAQERVNDAIKDARKELSLLLDPSKENQAAWDLYGKSIKEIVEPAERKQVATMADLIGKSKDAQAATDNRKKSDEAAAQAAERITNAFLEQSRAEETLADKTGVAAAAHDLFNKLLKDTTAEERRQAEALATRRAATDAGKASDEAATQAQKNLGEALKRAKLGMLEATAKTIEQKAAIAFFGDELARVGFVFDKLPEKVKAAIKEISKITVEMEKAAKKKEMLEDLVRGVEGIFTNAFRNLNQGFKGFFNSIVDGVEQMLQEIAAKYLAKQAVLGLIKLFGGNSADFDLGGFANGGNFYSGDTAVVGERGPEIVHFGRAGHVTPTAQLAAAGVGGGRGATVYMTVNAKDAQSFRQSEATIVRDLQRKLTAAEKRG